MKKLLTISELAQQLSVHPDTIRKWESLGYVVSLKTVGGHRRYAESEVEHLVHQMQFPYKELHSTGLFSDKLDTWFRKEKFLQLKRLVDFHRSNPNVANNANESNWRTGIEMGISALEKLTDEDWRSIDKIDEILEPIINWYKQHLECYFETSPIGKMSLITTTSEREAICCKLKGIRYALWDTNGIASYGEKSALEGKGSFPNERDQLALDIKNGWDGKTNRSEWRQKRMNDYLAERFSNANTQK